MNDRTPLGCVAVGGHDGVAKLLQAHKGVDPESPTGQINTAVRYSLIVL